jgi:hypothetical protein
MGGPSVIALVLLLSFGIDRVVSFLLFALSNSSAWRTRFPDPALFEDAAQKLEAKRRQKVAYYTLTAIFSIALLGIVGHGLLGQLGLERKPLDTFLTGIILMGGAEQVAKFSGSMGASEAPVVSEPPVQISGTLTLEEGTVRRLHRDNA